MARHFLKSEVSGPRWARLGPFLRKAALKHDCQIELVEDTGWISETIYFKVTGEETRINSFKADVNAGIENYNAN